MATDLNSTELEEPQSRNEKILAKALGTYTGELEEPQSRMEKLLSALTASIADIAGNGSTDSGSGSLLNYEIVETLPDSGEKNTIYFVKKEESDSDGTDDAAGKNLYREYVWLNDAFEELGGGESTAAAASDSSGSSGTVQADWSVTDETDSAYIQNKPAVKSGSGDYSVAVNSASASGGRNSFAEGSSSKASGTNSHAEGLSSTASGYNSHAECYMTEATATATHAEGYACKATAEGAHAEGFITKASGKYSHAEGEETVASGKDSHVCGRFNVEDKNSTYAEIVGNGTTSAASNARTLDWNGNEILAGKLTVGAAPEADMDVATKKYVDDLIAGLRSGS